MNSPIEIAIPLSELVRDEVLPPRIVEEGRLAALCEAIQKSGMAQPLVVRPVRNRTRGGPSHSIVVGYRRFLAAGRLGWDEVRAIVRDDLDDRGALLLAFDEAKTSEARTPLEDAWYYASMCAAGITQAALAEREGFSEAKASMYVRVGTAITPHSIASAGATPQALARLGITKLIGIATGEGEVVDRIRAELDSYTQPTQDKNSFEWREGRRGIIQAIFRDTDVALWSSEERVVAIDRLRPIVTAALQAEGAEDPSIADLRAHLDEVHRRRLLEVREAANEQIVRLSELNTALLLELNRSRHLAGSDTGPAPTIPARIKRALRRCWERRVPRPSMIEDDDSMVKGSDAQIAFRFVDERAA